MPMLFLVLLATGINFFHRSAELYPVRADGKCCQNVKASWMQWDTPAIPAIQESEAGGSQAPGHLDNTARANLDRLKDR
jgi:hypothetical protein